MSMRMTLATIVVAGSAAAAIAQHGSPPPRPYAGQQNRTVASLSAEELQDFLDGRGMGLAKAAEFNGYPGPMHVLDLAGELQLTTEQRRNLQQAFDRMRTKAMDLGGRYVEAERAVDAAFRSHADAATVAGRVADANRLLGEVRLAHLNAHLEITPLLTTEQRARYAKLRGYGAGDQVQHQHKH